MTTDRDEITGTKGQVTSLRPTGKAYVRFLVVALGIGVLVMARMEREYERPWHWDLSIGVAIAGVAALLATVWYFTARVWSDGRALHSRNLIGRVRTVPHGDVALVVLAPRLRLDGRFRSTGLLAFLGPDGDALLRLQGRQWTADQLCAFASVTGAPVERRDDVERAGQLRVDRPGALPFAQRRPGVLWAVVGAGYLVLIAAFVLIFMAD